MPDPIHLIVACFIILICTYIPVHMLRVYRTRQAVREIVKELHAHEAYGPFMAVELPRLKGGVRHAERGSFRAVAIGILTRLGLVRRTGVGKFFLEGRSELHSRTIACIRKTSSPNDCVSGIEEY
jgi:hypothetical protein